MKIGIIGSGNIGGNFGIHLAKAGHEVMFSSRHPEQLTALKEEAGPNAQTGTPDEAAVFGEVVVLSIPFKAIESVAEELKDVLRTKIIIDTCNPYPARDGEIATQVIDDPDLRQSGYTAQQLPHSKVVKALNAIYSKHLRDYAFRSPEERIALPIAGDDATAKKVVSQLLDDIGFDAVDLGAMNNSALIEVDQLLYGKLLSSKEMKGKLD
jgi:predicted dinucleotide-binding enzyme